MISGFDIHVNYAKVVKAVSYLRTPGCLFVSTNTDSRSMHGANCVLPGNVIVTHYSIYLLVLFNG